MINMPSTKIRVSYGTGIVLGLIKAKQDVAPTTAYLLWDDGCLGSCSFCPRASGNSTSKKLSRIIWPEFDFVKVLELLNSKPQPFKRICLQTGYNPENEPILESMAEKLIASKIKTSMTLSPGQPEFAQKMLNKGLDHVGVGLDCASPETYKLHKKRVWEKDWPALKALMNKMPDKIEVHLIYGLGDSEETFAQRLLEIYDYSGKVSMFAFTPVNGGSAPDFSSYRRLQALRFILETGQKQKIKLTFKDGRIKSFGVLPLELKALIQNGVAFRTSGCGDCNRPYYNEKPGQRFYNYPRDLTEEEFDLEFDEFCSMLS